MVRTEVFVVAYPLLGIVGSKVAPHTGLRFKDSQHDLECHMQGFPLTKVDVEKAHTHDKNPVDWHVGYMNRSVKDLVAECVERYKNRAYVIGGEDCWKMCEDFCCRHNLKYPDELKNGYRTVIRDILTAPLKVFDPVGRLADAVGPNKHARREGREYLAELATVTVVGTLLGSGLAAAAVKIGVFLWKGKKDSARRRKIQQERDKAREEVPFFEVFSFEGTGEPFSFDEMLLSGLI